MIGFALLQDNSAMESLQTVPSWSASHQLGPGGHGPQIHHRPHLQRLHFCVWVRHFHTPLPGWSKWAKFQLVLTALHAVPLVCCVLLHTSSLSKILHSQKLSLICSVVHCTFQSPVDMRKPVIFLLEMTPFNVVTGMAFNCHENA